MTRLNLIKANRRLELFEELLYQRPAHSGEIKCVREEKFSGGFRIFEAELRLLDEEILPGFDDDVPMALDQAAAVRTAAGWTVDEYLRRYDEREAELTFPTPIETGTWRSPASTRRRTWST